MIVSRRACLLSAMALLGAGCETPTRQRVYPKLSFTHLPPMRLNVARLDYVAGYVSPEKEPFVDHLFPDIPADVAMRWGRDRLIAVGNIGEATFTVKDASAVMTPLPRTQGIAGLVTQDQSERCDLRIAMSLEAFQPLPVTSGHAEAESKQSHSFPEDMTLNEREAVWFQMTEQAMRELDHVFSQTIRDKLGRLVVS
jgi:hypothetical protein